MSKFTITFIIMSLSLGLLCASIKVNATSVLSDMILTPEMLYKRLLRSKNQTNKNAAIRLFPSVNE